MRKVLFLLLFLVVLRAASVSAQVRIGGDGEPHTAAVLDLNVDDDTNDGTKGLALPRVSLNSDDAKLDGVTENLDGMLVYNTGGTLSAGVYFWNGSNWIMGSTDTIPGGGLTKTGDGNVGIKTGGVITAMIADGAVIEAKLQKRLYSLTVTILDAGEIPLNTIRGHDFSSLTTAPWISGCNASNAWVSHSTGGNSYTSVISGDGIWIRKTVASGGELNLTLFCYY